jgi:unsaturated rhamnogalacturonyl hydrolase
MTKYPLLLTVVILAAMPGFAQNMKPAGEFQQANIISLLYNVNHHFQANAWKREDRNWIRGTYYTGLMALYKITNDPAIFEQVYNWGAKHGWRTGTEWIYPANRLTCSQTYLELYFMIENPHMIKRTKSFMDKRVRKDKNAFDAGWFYVDALYVGVPAYMMMSAATEDARYADYGHRMFRQITDTLFDQKEGLYYRDRSAKSDRTSGGKKVFWSRGNGWAFASLPRILSNIPEDDPNRGWYETLFRQLAESISTKQGHDGLWRSSLGDPDEFPMPESSGSSFFTYGITWGINAGILERERFLPVVLKSWKALYHLVDDNGKVTLGQKVARAPGVVHQSDSDEYVAGAFLLAGSEIIRLLEDNHHLLDEIKN